MRCFRHVSAEVVTRGLLAMDLGSLPSQDGTGHKGVKRAATGAWVRTGVGAHNSVVGADQGFRAPSGDQESVRDSVHEDSASAPIAAVGAHDSVVGADHGLRAPSLDLMCRILYRFLALLARLAVRRGRSKDLEIIVLRHQLGVLHRRNNRPQLADEDRGPAWCCRGGPAPSPHTFSVAHGVMSMWQALPSQSVPRPASSKMVSKGLNHRQ